LGVSAPDKIFSPNNKNDIYSVIKNELGPWANDLERRAAMLEALRVLAGFESSWRWDAGVDTTNPHSNTSLYRGGGHPSVRRQLDELRSQPESGFCSQRPANRLRPGCCGSR
jgi:hypothetical protein